MISENFDDFVKTNHDPRSKNNETTAILNDIFNGYDKRVLPFVQGPVLVNMTIVLGILIELKENQQLAAYVISHTQRWYDSRLVWDPSKYRGQREVIVPQNMVWIPKLFVYNSLESKDMLTENRADVRLYNNGRIKINIPQYVQAICRIQTQAFPFDCQFCAVALASPLLNVEEMIVNATQPPRDSYFTGNAEWFLFNVTVRHMTFEEEGESRVEIHYIFHLQRRPIYYITVIVAPTFLISALSILGIFSPGSNDGPRNEKVSLGLGSLLAMTVLLGIVAGAMPKSNDIPLLGYYILVVIVLCAVAVGISMAFLAVSRHYIHKEQMPSKRLLRFMFLNEYRKRRSTVFRGVHNYRFSQECDDLMYSKVPEIQSICMMMEEIADSHRSMRRKADMKANKKLIEREWARVFARFDYFFLVVFETLNLSALAVFLRVAWLPTPELRDQIL
uniref:Neur_chan_LBD domain-containing protein n=1 Tax=Caenorhabditis tropicalis TaxID=1561998 RepID=A0A1I7SYT8_9PELO